MMGTSRELHYICLAQYENVTGFDEIEASGQFYSVLQGPVV